MNGRIRKTASPRRPLLVSLDLGHRAAASVEVLRGLGAGDEVVLFPSDQVTDGVRVKAR